MATKTYYFGPSAKSASGSNFGTLIDGGFVAPVAANSTSGWTVGTKIANQFCIFKYGTKQVAATFSASSQISALTGPSNTNADSWRTGNFIRGAFASGTWTFTMNMRAPTAAGSQRGNFQMRVWASPINTAASSVREITSGVVVGAECAAMTSTSTSYTANITWAAPSITLIDEYLFVQMEWNTDVAGGASTDDVVFRIGSCSIATTTFTPSALQVWTAPAANATNTTKASACVRNICGSINGGSALSIGGNAVRVTFQADATFVFNTAHCSIGIATGAASPNTTATPVELKFGGASGCTVANGDSITSDWMPLTFLSSNSLVIDHDHSVTASNAGLEATTAFIGNYTEASFTGYNVASPAGMASGNLFQGVTQIEAWTTPPAPVTASSSAVIAQPASAASQVLATMLARAFLPQALFTPSQAPATAVTGTAAPTTSPAISQAPATASAASAPFRLSPQNISVSATAGIGTSVPQIIITGTSAIGTSAVGAVVPGFVSPPAAATVAIGSPIPTSTVGGARALSTAGPGAVVPVATSAAAPAGITASVGIVTPIRGIPLAAVGATALIGSIQFRIVVGGAPTPWFNGIYALELIRPIVELVPLQAVATMAIGAAVPFIQTAITGAISTIAAAAVTTPTVVNASSAVAATSAGSPSSFLFTVQAAPAVATSAIGQPIEQTKIQISTASVSSGAGAITPYISPGTITFTTKPWFNGIYALNINTGSFGGISTAAATASCGSATVSFSQTISLTQVHSSSSVGSIGAGPGGPVTQGLSTTSIGQLTPKDSVQVLFSGPSFMGIYILLIPPSGHYGPATAAASGGNVTTVSGKSVSLSQIAVSASAGTTSEPINTGALPVVATSTASAVIPQIPFPSQQIAIVSSASPVSIIGSESISLPAVQATAGIGATIQGPVIVVTQATGLSAVGAETEILSTAAASSVGAAAAGSVTLPINTIAISTQSATSTGAIAVTEMPVMAGVQSSAIIGVVSSGWIFIGIQSVATASSSNISPQVFITPSSAIVVSSVGVITISSVGTGITVNAQQALATVAPNAIISQVQVAISAASSTTVASSVALTTSSQASQAAGTSNAGSPAILSTLTPPQAAVSMLIGALIPRPVTAAPSASGTAVPGAIAPSVGSTAFAAIGQSGVGFLGVVQAIPAVSTAGIGAVTFGGVAPQASGTSVATSVLLSSVAPNATAAASTATAGAAVPGVGGTGQAASAASATPGQTILTVGVAGTAGAGASAGGTTVITTGIGTVSLPQINITSSAGSPVPTIGLSIPAAVISATGTNVVWVPGGNASAAQSSAAASAFADYQPSVVAQPATSACIALAPASFTIPSIIITASTGLAVSQVSAWTPAVAVSAIGAIAISTSAFALEASGIAAANNLGVVFAGVATATMAVGAVVPSPGSLAREAATIAIIGAVVQTIGAIVSAANSTAAIGTPAPLAAFTAAQSASTAIIGALSAGPTPAAVPALASAIAQALPMTTIMAAPAVGTAIVGSAVAQIVGTGVNISISQAGSTGSATAVSKIVAAAPLEASGAAQAAILVPSALIGSVVVAASVQSIIVTVLEALTAATGAAQARIPSFVLSSNPFVAQATMVVGQETEILSPQVAQAGGSGIIGTSIQDVLVSGNQALITTFARTISADKTVMVASATSTVQVQGVTVTVSTVFAPATGTSQVGALTEPIGALLSSVTMASSAGTIVFQGQAVISQASLAVIVGSPTLNISFANEALATAIAESLTISEFITMPAATAIAVIGSLFLTYVPSIIPGSVVVSFATRGSVGTTIIQRGNASGTIGGVSI